MTLRISLRNGEPVIVNGAVLRAVGRTDLMVENGATILRGRDVMKPEEADTPARQLYFACMMAYIDQADLPRHQQALLERLETLMDALQSHERKRCASVSRRKWRPGSSMRRWPTAAG